AMNMPASAPGAEGHDAPTLTILFVDHSRVSQAVWNRVIMRLGHRALMTGSAEEALSCLAETQVDVVCTALSLPGVDGIDLCRRLRENRDHAALPVILLTTRNDPDTRERCRAAGITDVQAKSDVERLLRRLRIYSDQADASVRGRVLYVEDNDVTAHVARTAMRKLNLAVDHFNRSDAALAAFNVHDYDLVVTDIQSDGFGGIGLIKHIRALAGRRGRTPIVATSGDDTREHKSALFRLGIDDFLPKPALEEEIVARIGNLVRGKLLRDQVHHQAARLRELSLIDPLTGLLNAASLHELGPKYLSEAARHGYPLSFVLIAVDDASDAPIAAVGQLLHNACRGEDLVTRCGDRSFAILLPHCNPAQAQVRATRLRQEIASLKSPVEARVGVSGFSGETGLALGDLLAAAQLEMNVPLPDAQYEGDAESDQ
ncbi:MAG TPA: response regulator, partial [Gammaproteobacteria bacterium]|nr:response regulator [Gammaproteobacteria bacterium]